MSAELPPADATPHTPPAALPHVLGKTGRLAPNLFRAVSFIADGQ
jgi:hypothetical protein